MTAGILRGFDSRRLHFVSTKPFQGRSLGNDSDRSYIRPSYTRNLSSHISLPTQPPKGEVPPDRWQIEGAETLGDRDGERG